MVNNTSVLQRLYHSPLANSGPWEALITFQQLLILADKKGIVDMTAGAIARETTIPIAVIYKGLKALKTNKDGYAVKEIPGREWGLQIVNYAEFRTALAVEKRREYDREYWHTRRTKNGEAEK